MNSYPPELLAQLAPVMFVAGLDAPVAPSPSSAPSTTPLSLPSTSPPSASVSVSPPISTAGAQAKPTDAFTLLTLRLREALLSQRKPAIWNPEKSKSFQVILVDREVRFPPRKLVPPEDPAYGSAHSPLSPLTPTSPLHPDGLIAPIWIRKHTTLLPSVFVLFMKIFEYPPSSTRNPLDGPDTEREMEERKRDSELAADVALRKKSTNERGIKLTVVLMASRKMLDDPTLDARLTYIRRQSGLDSRAALFVLSPVSQAELGDFVKSLQQALYEPALEYYTAHSKRVRRKRNRHSQAASTYPTPPATLTSLNIARPLRPEGWTVRYEYKMACFAEFRGEDEVALKHYQDAYGQLIIMFGSTAILPPRTKRWAEAKVLADCMNVKVIKLYLYNNEHALALSHHNTHMRKFGDFSRGWGIGEETFEYWSWMARQQRILAELLEQGTRSTLVIPKHQPAASASNINLAASQQLLPSQRVAAGMELESLRSLGINPSQALQHPGFYYYMAARCTEIRRERFLAALELEHSQQPVALSPGFTNEKKVEHLNIILELYTKSYELFKKYNPAASQNQGRLTLWIAYRIAQTYYDSGKFDMAVRFFERIAKTYRREKWDSMLRPLLSTWYACAQQLGDVELSIRLLVEMLGHDIPEPEEAGSLEEDLLAVLKSTVPSTDEPLVVDFSESQPIFDSYVAFWSSEVKVNEPAAFQLCLTAPASVIISSIPFSSLQIHFFDDEEPVVIHHAPSEAEPSTSASTSPSIQRVDLGTISTAVEPQEVQANLRWQPRSIVVFTGMMTSDVPAVLRVKKLVLTIEENAWKIEIPFDACGARQGSAPTARWLSSLDPPRFIPIKREDCSSVLVKHRPHNVSVSLNHQSPAYLDEDYPIDIEVTNLDTRELDVVVDVLLQPTEIDYAINSIRIGEERSSGLIKDVDFGVLASGATVVKTLHLINTGAPGDRLIDISVRSRSVSVSENVDEDEDEDILDIMESLQALVVPTVEAIKAIYEVAYRHNLKQWVGLADLQTFEPGYWDEGRGAEALVSVKIQCTGPRRLYIESMVLEHENTPSSRILDSSTDTDGDDVYPVEYFPGDELGAFSCVSILAEGEEVDHSTSTPGRYIVKWRRILKEGGHGPLSTSIFPLPQLRPPNDDLVALLNVPPTATLHSPISLDLIIRNYHSSRSANVTVQLEPDTFDGFVVAGLRSGRVPVLMPGGEEKLTWKLIPIECGYVRIPRLKVLDRRKAVAAAQGATEGVTGAEAIGELVKVVDVRRDERRISGKEGDEILESQGGPDTILVLP
ncbi:Gryzun, putative trafficking through golgi-domain-containing protein [Crucibulum laeve]|uniref:Gryzun, putative trafficking through golgi-domain-containing protein n=1 Tax=Crucibulum laeve TaxID=68775 RepID=A0A5C3MJT3_9AGAR|nr:Gryzun, putative trafficking through golgi-domain-containing protein [Crucibulum laeve]